MRDGKADWTPAALAASANVFLDDFLLFDVSKPITDASFLEIEKSTLNGHAYQTGGGRTLDANVIDILMTWMVNHDTGEFMQGGATGATQPGGKAFPYLAPPNAQLQTVADSVDLSAPPDQVWALIGPFGGMWHPLIAKIQVTGAGIGQLRTIETIDGKQIIERLEAIDDPQRLYRYAMISGIPAIGLHGHVRRQAEGDRQLRRVAGAVSGGWPTRHYHKDHRIDSLKTGLEASRHALASRNDRRARISTSEFPLATAGDIAVINLESARQRSWSRFWQVPQRPGIAEYIVEQEHLAAQFLSDFGALDRLGLWSISSTGWKRRRLRTALIQAQVASMTHRFAEARSYLSKAGGPRRAAGAVDRLSLSIDQACGTNLDAVLAARRRMAAESGQLEDLVPLGALLADLRNSTRLTGPIDAHSGVPGCLPVRRGMGLLSTGRSVGGAGARAHNRAVPRSGIRRLSNILPSYVKARVHLAEIYPNDGRLRTRKPC